MNMLVILLQMAYNKFKEDKKTRFSLCPNLKLTVKGGSKDLQRGKFVNFFSKFYNLQRRVIFIFLLVINVFILCPYLLSQCNIFCRIINKVYESLID